MLKFIPFLFLLLAIAAARTAGSDEAQICNQENECWKYVKANNLEKYRTL